MTDRIFISYSSRDWHVAGATCAALEACQIKCWIAPRDIIGGVNYGDAIMEAISDCSIFVLIFSRHSNGSEQVIQEVERAIHWQKKVVAFRIEDTLPTGAMELMISSKHWLDAYTGPLAAHLPELCETVSRLIRKEGIERFLPKAQEWNDWLPPGVLWNSVKAKCDESMKQLLTNNKHAIGRDKYQKRSIEDAFDQFVESSAKGMFLIGDSGMGKTTLLIHLLTKYQCGHDLCAMFESRGFSKDLSNLEAHLVEKLVGVRSPDWGDRPEAFWTLVDDECVRQDSLNKRRLLVFIDAINEFNANSRDPHPIDLMAQLDEIVTSVKTPHGRVKFVITCRPETWRRATENSPSRFRRVPGTYFSPGGPGNKIEWTLRRFSDEEIAGAYENYRKIAGIVTPFNELSSLALYHLKNPFLLNLAASAYAGREIPKDLDTGSLFKRYFDELTKPPEGASLDGTIDQIVSEMFVGDEKHEIIQRSSFPRDSALASHNPSLYDELDFSKELRNGAKLKERNVIREWTQKSEVGNHSITHIRFTYDRFAEYLLSDRLAHLILQREKSGEPLPDAAKAIVAKNLAASLNNPIVYGALQRTLTLLRVKSSSYVAVLQAVSDIDARGQWLVISVLAKTARQQSGGIELLASLLKELGKRRSSARRRFPIIDSVYRVLRDEDYRLWLEEQNEDLRKSHLMVLYKHFERAFQEQDPEIWAVAVQYLFFLWQSSSPHAYTDAKAITHLIAESTGPAFGMTLSARRRREFLGLGSLMILVLSEVPTSRFYDAVDASVAAIRNLRLKKLDTAASLLVDSFVVPFAVELMRKLPNPVQLDSLIRYFENRTVELPIAEEVLSLLDKDCDRSRISLETLKRLARTDHSFTVQMLTFVVSVNYERAGTDEERVRALGLVKDLFYAEPRSPIAEYCASLALYHINFFGTHATQESMDLMGRMADSILADRQGHLVLSGKRHNFNIIGTFGRALHKHGKSSGSPGSSAMQYVLDSLRIAKETKNPDFYSYICREIGLLGVLVEPKYLFDVFTEILTDLRALDEHADIDDLPFRPEDVEKLTDAILQSLANIRVLHRQQVDKYLLEVLENQVIYADVATKRSPQFQLFFFISWAFEQLMFRVLVYHYEEFGRELIQSFVESMRCHSYKQCIHTVLSAFVKRCIKMSE